MFTKATLNILTTTSLYALSLGTEYMIIAQWQTMTNPQLKRALTATLEVERSAKPSNLFEKRWQK